LVPKNSIPERFCQPWEFKFSRDEVLYDMNVTGPFRGLFASVLRRLKESIHRRSALRRWQVLLSGRSLDEQLWAIRPPEGGLRHPGIRDWAQKTLALAGYDPGNMLLEWEIFWRRKGV
jgi:hypothetical protein